MKTDLRGELRDQQEDLILITMSMFHVFLHCYVDVSDQTCHLSLLLLLMHDGIHRDQWHPPTTQES